MADHVIDPDDATLATDEGTVAEGSGPSIGGGMSSADEGEGEDPNGGTS
ncbi:hypothetical protein BH23ACT2_BH23ACT2_05580 [soil metagenome]